MTRLFIGLAVGGGLGGLVGHLGRCSSGACPLTSTWWGGAVFGAILGALIASSFARS